MSWLLILPIIIINASVNNNYCNFNWAISPTKKFSNFLDWLPLVEKTSLPARFFCYIKYNIIFMLTIDIYVNIC